ncbi:MAG TPA: MASE4 domain-containing protein [Stellaceae bacterium]|nr:MASE4 domain-containing protein [Stellaceae bacterium]
MVDTGVERQALLSTVPATRAEERRAAGFVLVLLLLFLAAAPFARVPLRPEMGFIPSYQSALAITDLITAVLLLGQFSGSGSPALLALAGGYLFTALMALAHALSFPGLFSATGLLGAGPQSTAWLYMFWHAGFPLAAIGYAALRRRDERPSPPPGAAVILLAIAIVLALVGLLTAIATAGHDALPAIMRASHYTPAMIFVVSTVWLLSLAALVALWRRRPRSVLDLWLMVVMCAWLMDVALSAVLNAGRFDLGFYLGRLYGLMAASFVLVVLLLETRTLHARLLRSLDAERQERERRLDQVQSELIHVARVSEMGQMVSALVHEVNQPLTAVGNYIHAGQRLTELGEAAKARMTLAKAAEQATRVTQIIQRLRDFVKKTEATKRSENLSAVIDEAWSLAVIGAQNRAIEVKLDLDPGLPAALIDKVQIQQVLLNLMRNAIEALAESERRLIIVATTAAADGMIEVSLADTGPGLAEEVRERLFQPFVTTKAEGMGIGLSICRSIVEAHGGRLWVTPNPGGGTVFRFTVPRAPAVEEPVRGVA